MEILKTIDFLKYHFSLLTIETDAPESVNELLEKNGYRLLMKLGEDVLYVPKEFTRAQNINGYANA
jgi:hypothetical protein